MPLNRGEVSADLARQGRPGRVLAVAVAAAAAGNLPITLLIAVLPLLARDLHTSSSVVSWVVVAPTIAFAVGMPVIGRLGDVVGHRRVFLTGWTCATVLTLLTALSPDAGTLIALRTSSALAGAATLPASLAMLAHAYPVERRHRPFAVVTTVVAMSPLVAVVVGGPLVELVGWRAVFVVQAVLSAAVVAMAVPVLTETPRRDGEVAVGSTVALTVAVVASLFAVNRSTEWGIGHGGVVTAALTGVAGIAAFVVVDRRASSPLMPLQLFDNRDLTTAVLVTGFSQASFLGIGLAAPFLLDDLFGYGTGAVALALALRPAAFSIGAMGSGRSIGWLGARWAQVAGQSVSVAGTLVVAVGCVTRSVALVLGGLAVGGWGSGTIRPLLTGAVNANVEVEHLGVANGIQNMAGYVGAAAGQTLVVAVVADRATTSAYAQAAVVAVVVAAVGLLLSTRLSDAALTGRAALDGPGGPIPPLETT
ncbi:MAG: MFS transporter [Acidimicrobiia bacterium]